MSRRRTGRAAGQPSERPEALPPAPRTERKAHRSETADLVERVEAVEHALGLLDGRVAGPVVDAVAATMAGVRSRLALGVDHTIVALVGGTGSGKSSLFNAICGLEFADVGVRRPTTSEVTACVWGSSGDALLDWLGVGLDRRIQRESELDADSEAALRGLVLLDLPDHDSIEPAHRDVVDRLLPMADLLVWVVDPQKYADDALHSGYLRRLAGHEDAMLVVLNQVDTVRAEVRGRLEVDIARLLREDGLVGVRVLGASARTGTGVADLRAVLGDVAAQRSIAAVRAGAEVTDAATLLVGQVGSGEPGLAELPVERTVEVLAAAAGLPAVADALAAVVRGGGSVLPAFGAVQPDTVERARAEWLNAAGASLPELWQHALADRVSTTQSLRLSVDTRLAEIVLAARRSRAARALWFSCLLALLGALAGVAVVIAGVRGAGVAAADVGDGVALVAACALALLAIVLALAAFAVRRRDARRRAAGVRRHGRAVLDEIVQAHLVQPTLAVLGEHRAVRDLATQAARREPPTAGPTERSSPA